MFRHEKKRKNEIERERKWNEKRAEVKGKKENEENNGRQVSRKENDI